METPLTHYVEASDGISVAYQISGSGPVDLVVVNGIFGHIEAQYDLPGYPEFIEGLGRFARVIVFDKRGSGMSDRISGAPPLEERIRDVTAVMDAADSQQAVLFGLSEGGPMSILMSALHPDRVRGLILCGTYARCSWAEDYPDGTKREPFLERVKARLDSWGDPAAGNGGIAAPSFADDPVFQEAWARTNRQSFPPATFLKMWELALDIDVRDIVPTVSVPQLIIHREADRVVPVNLGRYLSRLAPSATYRELPGGDHIPWGGSGEILGLIEEFVTGDRPVAANVQRSLSTVLFTDIVQSTERASALGDGRWRQLLDRHDALAGRQVERFDGKLIKTTGDGILATFGGPARAIGCALALSEGVHGLDLSIRAGLHLGEIELRGDDVGGLAVHLASRVMSEANADEVLVTRTVRDVVAGAGFSFESRGEHSLKGIDGTWELARVGDQAPTTNAS